MKTFSVDTPLLKNKRAVIFGAGGAIGQAVAKEFAAQGATVFLSGRTLGAIEQVAEEIHKDGGIASAAQVDALDEQAVQAYLDRVAQEGSIDILLNAMGPQAKDYSNGTSTLELPLEQFMLPLSTLVPSQFITLVQPHDTWYDSTQGSSCLSLRSPHGGDQTPLPLARPLGPWKRS